MMRLFLRAIGRVSRVVGACALLVLASLPVLEAMTSHNAARGYQVQRFEINSDADDFASKFELEPGWQERAIDAGGRASVHSATLTRLSDGGIRAFWYGGSREGARDVGIYTARYQPSEGKWSRAREIMNRTKLSDSLGRYIKKLGNPVAFLNDSGHIWVFFVSVSLGGWSGSAVNAMVSQDGGETFGPVKRLVTSPFFNVSTLVKGRPIQMQDGSITLPVYQEFLGKFAELLLLDAKSGVVGKKRLTWGRSHIQPMLVAKDAETASVFLRYAGEKDKRIHYVSTDDAGLNFTFPKPSNLPNPDSAVDAMRLASDELLMVYNHSETARDGLSLAISERDPGEWERFWDLERSEGDMTGRFSYPAILRDAGGWTHVVYTYNRRFLKHIMFNDAWLARARRSRDTEQ